MKKALLLWAGLVVFSLSVMGEETITYRLQQVNTVKGGEKYVFVQSGRAMNAVITNGWLQTTESFATEGLMGNESYVWTLEKVKGWDQYYIKNNSGQSLYGDEASANLSFTASFPKYIIKWYISFDNNTATICSSLDVSNGKCLGYKSATEYQYHTYQGRPSGNPHIIIVYQLVPSDYTRDIAEEKIGTLGTICLPYQVSAPSGADFYQVAYKTVDTQNKPVELYYEQVTGPLEAGHPYLFISTATQLQLPADIDVPQAAEPVAVNGFYGTFKEIQDKATTDASNILENNYIIYNNQFQLCNLNCGLSPYRAYIKIKEVPLPTSAAAPTRKMVILSQSGQPQFVNSSSGTTTLSSVMTTDAAPVKIIRNGQVLILNGGQLYNIFGTKQ